jgi:hypothetical protein
VRFLYLAAAPGEGIEIVHMEDSVAEGHAVSDGWE